jgi:hypothetical protein
VFSDWASSFRKISVSALRGYFPEQHYHSFFDWNFFSKPEFCEKYDIRHLDRPPKFKGVSCNEPQYLSRIISCICDEEMGNDTSVAHASRFLGINLDGVLLIENASLDTSLQGNPRFIIRDGDFSLNGDRRSIVTSNMDLGHRASPTRWIEVGMAVQPSNMFSNGLLNISALLSKDVITLRYTIRKQERLVGLEEDVDIFRILDNLQRLVISRPCPHKWKAPRARSELITDSETGEHSVTQSEEWGDGWDNSKVRSWYWKDDGSIWIMRRRLYEPYRELDGQLVFHLFPVLANPCFQWALASFAGRYPDVTLVLQGQTCLDCIAQCFKSGTVEIIPCG